MAVDQNNPLCGDEVHLELGIDDGRVVELAHTGQGCSISQASASMMSQAITGRSLDEALDLIEHFRQMMHGAEPGDEERLGDAIALEGVAKYPVALSARCSAGWRPRTRSRPTTPTAGGEERWRPRTRSAAR